MFRQIPHSSVKITGGFFKDKQALVRRTTVWAVYDRFVETGRFEALKLNYKDGDPNRPHVFFDSDVAKWLEGAAYLIAHGREPKLERIIDDTVELIDRGRLKSGYFNSYFIQMEPEAVFTRINDHELYCAGHLIEAAIAYFEATGKRRFLNIMCDYADYIEKRFLIDCDTAFMTPGHEEIELALVKLYLCTGEQRYLKLSEFFINKRGANELDPKRIYNQSHLPIREQTTAEGHAVRAVYLYSAMADLAYYTGDKELLDACKRLFDNIKDRRMYITGGIGAISKREAFGGDYDLPNLNAYSETCASIGLVYFASRMLKLEADSKYADVIERAIYNCIAASTSLDGRSFFYENPLEVIPAINHRDDGTHHPITERLEVFSCSCCPPNIVRFIPSVGDLLYTRDEDTLYVHQFMQSVTEYEDLRIEQTTKYPKNGKIDIKISGRDMRVAVRIPEWYTEYSGETKRGYAFFNVKDGDTLELNFKMKPKFIETRADVYDNCGRYAVCLGPVVYCLESVDNGPRLRDIRLDPRSMIRRGKDRELSVPTLSLRAYRRPYDDSAPLYSERCSELQKVTAKLIPYYAFANRGESEMQIFTFLKRGI